jgi:hypothetical protein
VVRRMRRRVESLLREAGVKPGEGVVRPNMAIVLLMVKRKM